MKSSKSLASLLTFIFVTSCGDSVDNDYPTSENLYLGQNPPGLVPQAFAPGIVTTEKYEFSGVFAPDLKEFYYIRNHGNSNQQEFVAFKLEDNLWVETVISPRVGQAFIAPDGKTMHLGRRFMKRDEGGWGDIQGLGPPFENMPIMRLTASDDKTLFFDEFKPDFTGDIRYSRIVNGQYEEPRLLGETINGGASFHPFIAPDESYLIFDSEREDGYGDSDLYISYRQEDGSWGDAVNLGDEINTDAWEASASITPDGKYMFFSRNMGSSNYENVDIFWVDAQFIEALKPK